MSRQNMSQGDLLAMMDKVTEFENDLDELGLASTMGLCSRISVHSDDIKKELQRELGQMIYDKQRTIWRK